MDQDKQSKWDEQEKRLKENMSRIKNIFIVMSGKGGVGKSTVAVNLASSFSLSGKKTGLLDIDVHGPNIAKMLGIENQTIYSDEFGIHPLAVNENLKAVSMALTGHAYDQPIIWRGPMKGAVIRQFLSDVFWNELDYLILDAPPGTGDEPLCACQAVPNLTGAIIVTTPQDVSVLDARKSIRFIQELKIPVTGIIENMSGFTCPHCSHEINLFKLGGGEKMASDMAVPFLGRIPFNPEVVEMGDMGTPFILSKPYSASAKAFTQIVRKIESKKK